MRTETLGLGLYALAIGLVGLLGWELYSRGRSLRWVKVAKSDKDLKQVLKDLRQEARTRQPAERSWSYGERYKEWWRKIETANWIGREPPKPKDNGDPDPVVEVDVKPPVQPLTEIIKLEVVFYGGEDTRVVVSYLDPNVEVPKSKFVPISGTSPSPSVVAPGRVPSVPGQPLGVDGTGIYHGLRPGESLYKRYDQIRFERVEPEGPSAVFSRPDPSSPDKRMEEEVFLAEFAITNKNFSALDKLGITQRSTTSSSAGKPWRDPGQETQQVDDVWMVSSKDHEMIENDYDRLLREDVGVRDFVADWTVPGQGRTRVKGVEFQRVSQKLGRFGVQAGDVLIKVNGQPVSSKASAIREGKRQYKRGTRTFNLTFLSNGREVVRTYRVPDKK